MFWEYVRIGDKSLGDLFPRLYNLTFIELVSAQFVKSEGFEVIEFSRTLHDEIAEQWEELKHTVDLVEQRDCKERVSWTLNNMNKFVVKDLCLHLKASRLV